MTVQPSLTTGGAWVQTQAAPQLRARLGELRAALEQIPGEVSPTVAGLLQQLSPLQVQQLREQMAKENAELRREFVAPPLEQQIEPLLIIDDEHRVPAAVWERLRAQFAA